MTAYTKSMDATLIPSQHTGAKTGATVFTESATRHDAILLFEEAKRRLLNINQWQKLCGPASATFQLTDAQGKEISGMPQVGNYIRISLPAPPNAEGEGYDWVRIEEFENKKDLLKDQEIFGFRVRPANNPLDPETDTAHFYKSTATSTFLITRVSTKVTATEKGRNEIPNNRAGSLLNKVRNIAISLGAWLGLSQTQWGMLMKGIIKGPPQD